MQIHRLILIVLGSLLSQISIAQTGFDTYVPSSSAGTTGLAVHIETPSKERYGQQCGAPIVTCFVGGDNPDQIQASDFKNVNFASQGFIKVAFNYPGGGTLPQISGGTYDSRGPNCIQAAYDALRFLTGQIADNNGKFLADLIAPIIPDYDNVGIIANSNGGNMSLIVSGKYGDKLSGLKWIVNWESPIGDGHYTLDKGSSINGENLAYDTLTNTFDFSKLRYSSDVVASYSNFISLKGGFYFDNDNDNKYKSGGADYGLTGMLYSPFGNDISYYSETILHAADSLGIIPNNVAHLPSISDDRNFWLIRNGSYYLDSVVMRKPDLFFMLLGSVEDHMQGEPNHPHLIAQYEPLRKMGLKFVRLNPDKSYIENVSGKKNSQIVDNDAYLSYNYTSIKLAVEPEAISYNDFVIAGACEAADRVLNDNTSANLSTVLPTQCVPVVTGIQDIVLESSNIKFFPNPVQLNETLHIQIDGDVNALVNIKMYDVLGKIELMRSNLVVDQDGNLSIFTINLEPGTYFVQLQIGEKIENSTLVISK